MKNPLKEKVNKGEVVIGTYVGLGHPDVAEWLARVGCEWLLLDTEHSPTSYETLQQMMQAMNGTGCVPIVRPQGNDPVAILEAAPVLGLHTGSGTLAVACLPIK